MGTFVRVPARALAETFGVLRSCGRGQRECQVLWLGPLQEVDRVVRLVHPDHRSHGSGFELESGWITRFWIELAEARMAVRVQVHSHPREAFHSKTDDEWPIVGTPGFLSLVVPNFGTGPIGFRGAFLAELSREGRWNRVEIAAHLEVV